MGRKRNAHSQTFVVRCGGEEEGSLLSFPGLKCVPDPFPAPCEEDLLSRPDVAGDSGSLLTNG